MGHLSDRDDGARKAAARDVVAAISLSNADVPSTKAMLSAYDGDPMEVVEDAVRCGNVFVVDALAEAGYSVTRDVRGRVLTMAVENRDVQMITKLLELGADPSGFDQLALRIACENGYDDVVRALIIDGGADSRSPNDEPIACAASARNPAAAHVLLRSGARVTCKALVVSAIYDRVKTLSAMISWATDVDDVATDALSRWLTLALTAAVNQRNTDVVRLLVSRGAVVHDIDTMRTLIQNGGLKDIVDIFDAADAFRLCPPTLCRALLLEAVTSGDLAAIALVRDRCRHVLSDQILSAAVRQAVAVGHGPSLDVVMGMHAAPIQRAEMQVLMTYINCIQNEDVLQVCIGDL
jgi:hypothetical protein